jgi:hypothetical protein
LEIGWAGYAGATGRDAGEAIECVTSIGAGPCKSNGKRSLVDKGRMVVVMGLVCCVVGWMAMETVLIVSSRIALPSAIMQKKKNGSRGSPFHFFGIK